MMDIDAFFQGFAQSRSIFETLRQSVEGLQPTTVSVTKSQIAFRRRRAFAWAWVPDRYLRGRHAPLVLSVALRRRDHSQRWKQVVEPTPGRFMHHLELNSPADIDDEVLQRLREAWDEAG